MADTNKEVYKSKKALPNKVLQEDGIITDLLGNRVISTSDAYDSKPALPNKWLNADGTYSTLMEILADAIDTELYIVVNELPASGDTNKIYLLIDGDKLLEYHWTGTKWDPVGMVEFDLSNYLSKTNTTEYTPTANYHPATKKYVDDSITTNITNVLNGSY